jgi:hypothetical protein
MPMRLPLIVIGVLLAVLVPVGFATESDPAEPEASTPVATIAARVEALRGLRFETDPVPVRVTADQATREGLADLDRAYPPAARRADEDLYTMLGLLPAGTDLRETSESIFGEQVAGYYDPRTERLRIVEGAATNRVVDEMIIAHELDHALEDQALGLDLDTAERSDDRGYAYKALVEGSATELMTAYVARHFGAEQALGGLLESAFATPSTANLPPFVLAGLLFPYEQGQRFVDDLYGRTDSWQLVDLALGDRPPVSTEQIMHPDKWIAVEQPDRVGVPSPGPGWERLTAGTFGEWQTGQLLALAGGAWADAAAGWGGDRYALYRRGDDLALAMHWTHDSARDGAEFLKALRGYVEDGLGAAPAHGQYRVDGRFVALSRGAGGVRLSFAPDPALARRLAQ